METLLQDARYALSTMRRNKGFTAAGLLTLALGIGATTAVFSVVDGVLLKPLPYPNAGRLVQLSEEHPGAVSPLQQPMLSNLTYYTWSRAPRTVEALAAYANRQYTVRLSDGAVRLDGAAVTPSLFALVGATPAAGRFFDERDSGTNAEPVVILSDRGWRERFGADPAIVGRGVEIDGKPHTIIGVTKPGIYFPSRDTLLWTPYAIAAPAPETVEGGRGLMSVMFALARLKPGITPEQAEAEGTAAARTLPRPMAAKLLFGEGGTVTVHVRTVVDEMTRRIRPALVVLSVGVVFVLLIACVNVANLFLSRGVARQRELAVRVAIGAGRGRLIRQLLTESLVLASLGGALGVFLAWALVHSAPAIVTRDFPRIAEVALDGRVVAFAAFASVFSAVLAGLAPALRGARFDLVESLHGGDGASAGGFRGARTRRLRDALLVAEAAFAVLLVVGATLLARSFVRLTHVDAGYNPSNVLVAQVFVPGAEGPQKRERVQNLVAALLERARALPGAAAAGVTNMMPLDNTTQLVGFPAPGSAVTPGQPPKVLARALLYLVTPGYAEAVGLRVRTGRVFDANDPGSAIRRWVVNLEFARLYLPPNPVGYQWQRTFDKEKVTYEIIGIVANVLKNGNDSKPQPETYQLTQPGVGFTSRFELVVRTFGDPSALAPHVRPILRELEPAAAVETATLGQRLADSVDQPRFAMTVLVAFAVLALALASVGLYGVMSYSVSQRRRELGLRAALGATRGDLLGLVVREGLAVTGAGLLVGLAAAGAATRLMQSVLFGVGPLDAVSFIAAPIVLVPVALAACLLPAARAAAVDPAGALRCE